MRIFDINLGRSWLLGIKIAISGLFLAIAFWVIPLGAFLEVFKNVRPALWLGVLAAYLVRHFFSAWKWWLLLGPDPRVPFSKAVRAYFWGLFANLYVPGVAGGDLVKISLLARNSGQKTRIVVRSLAERAIDICSLLLVSLGGALFLIGAHRGTVDLLLKLFLFCLPVALGLLLIRPAARAFSKLPAFRGKEKIERALLALLEIKKRPGILAIVIFLSVAGNALFVVLNILLVSSSTATTGYAAWFFAWPLAKVCTTFAITIGGLGFREGALAALLLPFGGNVALVVAVGLLWQTIVFAGGFLSGLISLCLDRRAVRDIHARSAPLAPANGMAMTGRPAPAADRVEILLYHSISDEPGVTSIPPETFREHLRILAEEGYSAIDFADLMEWRKKEKPLPPRAVLLTFDDGFQDFAENAYPCIREQNWPATVFLPTGCAGQMENWEGANDPPRRIMDWETVNELSRHRIRFGAHSVSHPDLTALPEAEAEREIKGSIAMLGEQTGERPSVFATPYGKSNAQVREMIGAQCAISVGTDLAAANLSSNPLDLPRIEMHYFRDLHLWRAYLRGEAEFYFRVRVALRRTREVLLALLPRPRAKPLPPNPDALCSAP